MEMDPVDSLLLDAVDAALARAGSPWEKVQRALRALHDRSARHAWTGVYLLLGDTLVLGPFVGSPTDHTRISVGQGVCGTAVAEGRDLDVPDVSQVANYLACSLETRSELVVLIRDGDRVLGQIDVDSHQPGEFGPAALKQVRAVADRLGPAMRQLVHEREEKDRPGGG